MLHEAHFNSGLHSRIRFFFAPEELAEGQMRVLPVSVEKHIQERSVELQIPRLRSG
jgi:hypothetical protein